MGNQAPVQRHGKEHLYRMVTTADRIPTYFSYLREDRTKHGPEYPAISEMNALISPIQIYPGTTRAGFSDGGLCHIFFLQLCISPQSRIPGS
jgi:hypothetical protein